MTPSILSGAALVVALVTALVVYFSRTTIMKMQDAVAILNGERQTWVGVRADVQALNDTVASLQTALPEIEAALKAVGGNVSPELEAAVLALREDGRATLAMREIAQASKENLSAITTALLDGARKPAGDLSA